MREQKPLYRSVNTRTHGVRHGGGDYKWARNTKPEKGKEADRGSMHAKKRNGLDYTPLFNFLLANVGKNWDEVHRAAVARLDRPDPIFALVARSETDKRAYVRVGESSYFSGLFVDENNNLARVDPGLRVEDMKPLCPCCTHTFNGQPYVRKFEQNT